jgi:hypothetical protein
VTSWASSRPCSRALHARAAAWHPFCPRRPGPSNPRIPRSCFSSCRTWPEPAGIGACAPPHVDHVERPHRTPAAPSTSRFPRARSAVAGSPCLSVLCVEVMAWSPHTADLPIKGCRRSSSRARASAAPPLPPPMRSCPSSHPFGCLTTPTPRLDLVEAQTLACFSVVPRASLDFELQRWRRHCLAAGAHQRHLHPNADHQRPRGELLVLSHYFPGRPHRRLARIPAGRAAPLPEDHIARSVLFPGA